MTETTESEARKLRAANADCCQPLYCAPLSERFVVWLRNLWHWRTKWAFSYLSKHLQRDLGFRESWHANIAMPIYDTIRHDRTHLELLPGGTRHGTTPMEVADECADRLMKHLFNA